MLLRLRLASRPQLLPEPWLQVFDGGSLVDCQDCLMGFSRCRVPGEANGSSDFRIC